MMMNTGMQLEYKALQEDVEENEAKKETPIYVGHIYCCTQITKCSLECKFMEYILAFVVSLFASAIGTTCNATALTSSSFW